MSTGLLRLHEPAMLIITLGNQQRRYIYHRPLPVDLEAPVREVSCPDELDSVSCPHDSLCARTSHLKTMSGGGIVLVKLWLILFPGE